MPWEKKEQKKNLSSDFINSELALGTSYRAEAALLTFNLQEAPIRKHQLESIVPAWWRITQRTWLETRHENLLTLELLCSDTALPQSWIYRLCKAVIVSYLCKTFAAVIVLIVERSHCTDYNSCSCAWATVMCQGTKNKLYLMAQKHAWAQ